MGAKLTTERFIERSKKVHPGCYTYERTVYERMDKKVIITCKEHGDFSVEAKSHLTGVLCKKCGREKAANSRRRSTADFIKLARDIHGDTFIYDDVAYIEPHTKVTITCREHGPFFQTPNAHLRGQGCQKCAGNDSKNRLYFLKAAKRIHGDSYDYSKVEEFETIKGRKLTIGCPLHGDFLQLAESHLLGMEGCEVCATQNRADSKRRSNEDFVLLAQKVHGEKYNYDGIEYVDSKIPLNIVCGEHGPFLQSADSHLKGHGCPFCAGQGKYTNETFIAKAREKHGNKFNYDRVSYAGIDRDVTIICPEHGQFEQTPFNHFKSDYGCPACAPSGFDRTLPAELYYVRISRVRGSPLYMIGITNRAFEKRYSQTDQVHMVLIERWQYAEGLEALERERGIKQEFKSLLFKGKTPLTQKGNTTQTTEVFTQDVLRLDGGNIREILD